jgi:hypothetical protein
VTIGLAVSHDWGASWRHARPVPDQLVFAVPYTYNATQPAYGWGDPSNIVRHPTDGHFYVALWNRNQVGLQAPGICMARTRGLLSPGSWRGWDGSGYTVRFVSPYTMAPGDEAKHICTVTNLPAGDTSTGCAPAGLAWSSYLGKFIVTLGCGSRGFQLATSDDLIRWSTPVALDVKRLMPPNVSKMVVDMNYPTFMDVDAFAAAGDRNYQVVGRTPHLFWASIGHSPHTDGRHLWATPFSFQKL